MTDGVFITGTDTGVGKTVVAAAILSALVKGGADAIPMKVIQTGCTTSSGKLVAPDLEFVLSRAGLNPSHKDRELMCPYRFKPACSPHLAAAMAGRTISLTRIAKCFRTLALKHEMVIVEGAGGILAPIAGGRTMLDLMKTFHLPVILVARPGLGTINHTLLSINELRHARIQLAGVIFNQTEPGKPGFIEKDNLKMVAKLGRVKILGCVPFDRKLRQ